MDPEAYYDLTTIRDVAVAPTGERVAFVTAEFDAADDERRSSVWTVPADGSAPPRRLTRVSDAGTPAWSPSGRRLAFTAVREEDVELAVDTGDDEADEDDDSGEEPESQVWVFDLERGGDARQVTDFEEGVSDFDWGPDGDRVVAAVRDPTEDEQAYLDQLEDDGPVEIDRLQHKQNGTGYLDEVTTYLHVVDIDTRATTKLEAANDRGYGTGSSGMQPAWGTDRIAYCSWDTDAVPDPDDTAVRDVFTIRPDGTDRQRVTDAALATGRPTWGPAGDRLAFTGSDPENFYVPTELYVTDPDRSDYASVSASLDRTIGYADLCFFDDTTVVTSVGTEGVTRLASFDVAADDPTVLFEDWSDRETLARGRAGHIGGDTVAIVRSVHDEGTDIYTLDTGELGASTPELTRVTRVNEALIESHDQPALTRLAIEADDGTTVDAIAYYPKTATLGEDRLPLLVKIHGGPMAYDDPAWGFDETFWTNEGYLVLEVNYRGSTSYGRAFCEALRGAWNGKEVADLLAAVDDVLDRGWVNPEALFCTGFSQGGVNTAYLITATDRFAAAAAEHGIYDVYSSFGTDDSQVWLTADNGVPWDNEDRYRAQSSITDVGEVATPTLLTAGEQDWRCPPTQAEQFYVSLSKRGVESKLVIYQGEHHAISSPDRAIHRLTELRDWFARYR